LQQLAGRGDFPDLMFIGITLGIEQYLVVVEQPVPQIGQPLLDRIRRR
jgi:hypothetical protein